MLKTFWAGSTESYNDYMACVAKAEDFLDKGGNEDSLELPPLYEREGSVGVVKIVGHLTPGEAGFYRFFGITGYEDIKSALIEAIQDKGATSIMLAIRSPGGSVEGVSGTSEFVRQVSQVKPTSAFSDMAASAAYWIGSAAPHITTSDTGMNGSIGTVKIHREVSKALADRGETITVMRAGKYKMLENPYEPLSEEAKAQAQIMLDDLYESFANTVAENRNTTYIIADQVMGQGKVFMGKRGVEAGLVDKVGTYEDALAYAASSRTLAPRKTANIAGTATASLVAAENLPHNDGNILNTGPEMKNKNLTADQLAALAAGVPGAAAEITEPTAEEVAAAAQAVVDAEAAAAAVEAAAKPPATDDTAIVAFLKGELSTAQAAVATSAMELATVKSQVTDLQASQSGLSAIVAMAVGNMSIALGQRVETSGMSAASLLEVHASLSSAFTSKFKVGGVAGTTASTTVADKKPAAVDPKFRSAVQSLNK